MHRYLIFFVIFLGSINSLNAQDNFTFGACEPGKESCQECYLTLVKELLGNDGNVFNLSYVFTSPVHDEPSAVVVNYHFRFDNDTPDEVDTWFWAQSGAYILHPLFIFQFISLFFGNPKPIYEQVVNVTLNATECYGVQNNLQYMILLTQRLNAYLDEQKIDPRIPDSYSAIAVNDKTLDQVINNISDNTLQNIKRKDVLITHPMIAMGGTLIVMVTVLIIYACCGGSIQKRRLIGLSTQAKATIISIVFISFGRIFLFIGLDAGALGVRNHHVDRQVHSIYHNGQKAGDLNSIMYNIPVALLVIDAVAFVACLGISIVALCFKFIEHFQIKRCYSGIKGSHYYVLCLTVIPLIISAYSHAPYIIMAYVSDASYASSIFIYYVVAIFVEFGVLEYTFSQFLQKHRKIINRICLFVSAFFLSVFVNAIMAIIFTFFFFIPIKYALRRAPSEVLVIYQAAIILVGGYITYKAVFEGKNGQQENFKTNRSLKNNDLLMFYLMELDEMTHSKCTGFHSTNGDVDNTIKKRAYLRNEMALTSLKHKVNFLQSEKDTDNSTEITELEDEICNLNRMINAYLEEELKLLENDSLTNGQFRVKRVKVKCLRNKIYSTDIDIIDYLREKISQWHSHDQSLAWIITIRKEMSTSIVRAFSWFADNQNEVNALKTRITNMDKSFKITEPGLKSDLSDIQNAEDIALRYGEITDKERMIGTTQDVEKVRSDIDSLWLKIVASIKERISHRKQRLQQLQNSPSSGTLIGKAQIDSLQAEIVTQTMEQTRVKLKQMQRKVECRQQLEPQCVEEYRHNTTYIITLTLNRIVYRKEAISRIQGEHVLITCTISPEHLMQIDSMRTEIIKLGMQILQMLEDESHSEIEQLRAPYAIPNLDRINLIDETCTCIGERITHLNQLIKSCSIHQHCYSTIKVEIELLAEQKKKLQTTKGSITLQV